ncbi:unnamed protein product [Calypogeia fissa]
MEHDQTITQEKVSWEELRDQEGAGTSNPPPVSLLTKPRSPKALRLVEEEQVVTPLEDPVGTGPMEELVGDTHSELTPLRTMVEGLTVEGESVGVTQQIEEVEIIDLATTDNVA